MRWRRWIGGALGAAALGALYYFLATLGPQMAVPRGATPAVTTLSAGQAKVSGEIAALESAAEAPGQTVTAQGAALDAAIKKQRALNAAVEQIGLDQGERLERLQRARASLTMEVKRTALEALLVQAQADEAAGRAAAGRAKYREALARQREINRSPADARLKDFARELQLTQHVERGELEPLAAAVREAEERVGAATAAEDWDELVRALKDAREAQLTINQKFGRSAAANLGAIDRYDAELTRYAARAQRTESDKRERGADAALAARRWEDAIVWYTEAQTRQRDLNQRFPQSRFASAQRVDELEIKRQTACSAEAMEEAGALDREAAGLLRKRQTYAAEEDIAKAAAKVAQVATHWPKSTRLAPALKLKLDFLVHERGQVRALQDRVYARLLPMPGRTQTSILRGPVDQRLYRAVMTDNPSRAAGEGKPVESVTWRETQEFCQRIGWLLGATVRLPTAPELAVAVTPRTAGAENAAVALYAQRGRMAEWLQAEPDAAEAPVSEPPAAGGGAIDAKPVDKKSRAADRGFRLLIEFPTD